MKPSIAWNDTHTRTSLARSVAVGLGFKGRELALPPAAQCEDTCAAA